MTTSDVSSSRVRAVARVGSEVPTLREAATFVPRRRHDRIGAVSVIQLLLVELVLVGIVAAAAGRNLIVMIAAGVLALAVLVLTFGRSRGRWWTETLVLRWHCRQRRALSAIRTDDRRLAALHGLVPDLTVQTIELSGSERIGVGRDGSGWFAVAAVLPPEGMRGDPQKAIPLEAVARVLVESEQPGVVAQVATHTVPAPLTAVPATDSYQELMRLSGQSIPCDQVTWVAVRLDARTVAEAAIGSAEREDNMPPVVAALVRRVVKRLKRAGIPAQALDGDGMLDALVRSCDLDQHHPTGGPPAVREDWDAWRSPALAHATFWVRTWPDLDRSGSLLGNLTSTPAAFTSVAMILEPRDDGIDLRCLTRVAAPPETFAESCRAMRTIADQGGGQLFRINGEQAPAVYASAPSGGGAR